MKLSPSLLSADFARLYDAARSVEPIADRFHWDVMDGHFVPNLTVGPPVVNALRDRLVLPFDVHLMIEHPADYAPRFDVRPDDSIIFHVETADDPREVIRAVRAVPARVGVTLRPGTPLERVDPYLDDVSLVLVMSVEPGFGGQPFLPDAIDRIRALRAKIGERSIEIAVDGGIHAGNVRAVVDAGADIVIAGSAIFGQPDPAAAATALREAATG
jgi:ribulose-phosphate 3-epimerase